MIEETERWMENKNFNSIDEFRGLANNARVHDPAFLERIQFMKYFGDREDIILKVTLIPKLFLLKIFITFSQVPA